MGVHGRVLYGEFAGGDDLLSEVFNLHVYKLAEHYDSYQAGCWERRLQLDEHESIQASILLGHNTGRVLEGHDEARRLLASQRVYGSDWVRLL
jgi:hypothetical protein